MKLFCILLLDCATIRQQLLWLHVEHVTMCPCVYWSGPVIALCMCTFNSVALMTCTYMYIERVPYGLFQFSSRNKVFPAVKHNLAQGEMKLLNTCIIHNLVVLLCCFKLVSYCACIELAKRKTQFTMSISLLTLPIFGRFTSVIILTKISPTRTSPTHF